MNKKIESNIISTTCSITMCTSNKLKNMYRLSLIITTEPTTMLLMMATSNNKWYSDKEKNITQCTSTSCSMNMYTQKLL